ncbi:MAG: hypothetical protein LC122_07720 [Chitinophagales bacterium]|nr:hypothetical protein [Chitinophagales bacterium]
MKFLTGIFIIYFLALSIMPCNDAHDICLNNAETATLSQNYCSHHQPEDNDFCSPFCTCNCCRTSTTKEVNQLDFILTSQPNQIKEKISTPTNFYLFNYFNNIWQPPKIG